MHMIYMHSDAQHREILIPSLWVRKAREAASKRLEYPHARTRGAGHSQRVRWLASSCINRLLRDRLEHTTTARPHIYN